MPAIMIRQLDALAKILRRSENNGERALLANQAAMIERLAVASVDEPADLVDVRRAYRAVISPSASWPGHRPM